MDQIELIMFPELKKAHAEKPQKIFEKVYTRKIWNLNRNKKEKGGSFIRSQSKANEDSRKRFSKFLLEVEKQDNKFQVCTL